MAGSLGIWALIGWHSASREIDGPFPPLTRVVNDFAGVVDAQSAQEIDTLARALQRDTGDVVIVATVQTCEAFSDMRECSMRIFDNHGRGIGQRGKDNGVLVALAVDDRAVRITTGLGMEAVLTDSRAKAISQTMASAFARGSFGTGLRTGVDMIVTEIREARKNRNK
jgi:uncharacterized protein